jgi:molybdopterin-guanine dinucleotide biosynthesis protein A
MIESLSLVIQAGGESRRMREDKALRPFLGRPLITRVIDRLGGMAGEILITSNHPENYAFLQRKVFPDQFPRRGTLGGLHTAMASASLPYVAVVACDLPFASAVILERMVIVMEKEGVDAVVPSSDVGWEPMHAVYRRESCLPAVSASLEAGEWKAIDWFPHVRVRALTLEEAAACDPSGLAFWNINTPEEFAEAEQVAGENEGI